TMSMPSGSDRPSPEVGKSAVIVATLVFPKEGMGEITIVSSTRRLIATTVVCPQRVQRNCTLGYFATRSSLSKCCWPQCVQLVCIVLIYHAWAPAPFRVSKGVAALVTRPVATGLSHICATIKDSKPKQGSVRV